MADSTQTKNRRSAAEEDGRPVEDEEQEERDEEPRAEERKDPDREEDDRGDRPGTRLTAKELAEAAISTIADLTGLAPESVTALQWDGESWLVTVDVLELARIPNTTDVLASYVVQLDDSGELLGYKRTRRFLRGQVESD